jgi:putative lipoprotein (rSAM/lipoprotein system)
MKDLFLRFCRWALPLLGVTASISCDNVIESPDMYGTPPSNYDDMVCMYGSPVVDFSVKGKVMDSEGNPIPGIEISYDYSSHKVYTLKDGSFDYTSEDLGFEMETVTLSFTDIDGEENGGDFQSKEVAVERQQTEPGDGGWNYGKFEAENVEIVMTKK